MKTEYIVLLMLGGLLIVFAKYLAKRMPLRLWITGKTFGQKASRMIIVIIGVIVVAASIVLGKIDQ